LKHQYLVLYKYCNDDGQIASVVFCVDDYLRPGWTTNGSTVSIAGCMGVHSIDGIELNVGLTCCRHLDDVHVPSERSMAQLRVQMEIIGQLEAQVTPIDLDIFPFHASVTRSVSRYLRQRTAGLFVQENSKKVTKNMNGY